MLLHLVLSEINSLKKGQIEVKEFLDARIDKLAQYIKMDINNAIDIKLQKFKTEMDMHIHAIGTRIDFLEQKVSSLEANTTSIQPENQNNPLKNNELCILARGIPYRDHENLNDIVGNLINEIKPVGQVEVTAAERLKARNKDQTPLLKIAFADIDQKIAVLRAKQNLANSNTLNKVRILSSKSHTERLIELNFKTLLNVVPGANEKYRIAGNGKLIEKGKTNYQPNSSSNKEQPVVMRNKTSNATSNNQLPSLQNQLYIEPGQAGLQQPVVRLPATANFTSDFTCKCAFISAQESHSDDTDWMFKPTGAAVPISIPIIPSEFCATQFRCFVNPTRTTF